MMTPEEIKKGLACPVQKRSSLLECSECAYHGRDMTPCRTAVHDDAIAYIEQLEEQVTLMKLQMRGDCGTCKHRDEYETTCKVCCDAEFGYHPQWEYEGLPEVERK